MHEQLSPVSQTAHHCSEIDAQLFGWLAWDDVSATQGQVITKYYYAGSQRVAMRSGSSTLNFLLDDHLGSTSVTTSSTGTSPKYQLYKPFGEVRYTSSALPTKYTFTGQYSNVADFGLMYYGARWYDVSLGRFAQADTLIPEPGNPQSWDRYSYVYNNPIRYIDPSGNTPWDVVDVIFFLLSVNDFALNPTWGNAGWLLLDTVGLAPIVPSVSGYVRRGAQAIGLYDEVVQFAAKYGDNIYDFAQIAYKRGATTLMEKFLKATTKSARKGVNFELEFALKNSDDIVEIGRKLPGNSEIDFVLKGDIFVNVKNYDWTNTFYSQKIAGGLTGLDLEIQSLLKQAQSYQQYSNGVKYVFKGSVPDKVRSALEAVGIIVEVIP